MTAILDQDSTARLNDLLHTYCPGNPQTFRGAKIRLLMDLPPQYQEAYSRIMQAICNKVPLFKPGSVQPGIKSHRSSLVVDLSTCGAWRLL